MTTPHNPEAPEVILAEAIPAAAGAAAAVPVTVRHRGRRPARIRVTIFGLDSRWVPQPLDLGILQPGDSAAIKLSILPERGALGARYPFTIAAEASALDGRTRPVVGVAESVLALDSAERISMAIVPSTPAGTFSKGFRVEITNPSGTERTFALVPDSANGVRASLSAQSVTVPPERTVAVKGRVHVKKPTVFGGHNTHTFTVSAQGTGAPEWAEATMRSTPLVGKGVTAIVGLILVVALWATLAIVFIPKISNAFKPKNEAAVSTASTEGAAAGDGTQGTQGTGAQGAGNGTGNGSGNGKDSGNGSGNGTSANSGTGAQPAGGYQLSGTVTGSGANGATVSLTPVSLTSAGDDGTLPPAQTVGENPNALRGQSRAFAAATSQGDPVGKILGPLAAVSPGGFRTTTVLTTEKGEFTFSGITAPGYYLLTIAKAGYQTQRFLINSVTLAAPQPLKVELQPGAGKLSGTVTGPGGAPLGAATIVVTDGTVTLQTSSVSASTHSGTPGTWTLDQVSTPGTYLVTASSPGLGAASTLVTLDASGTATVNLTLHAGQASITGTVSGADSLGNVGGLGGITVTATGGDVTRTTTTVTSAAMRGAYVLPNLPTPGTYTLAITGPGFLAQTRTVTLAAGSGNVVIDATLSRADAVVTGRVTGLDANGKAEGGLAGVGLTLASNDVTMKTVSTSGATAGSFQFTGVAPGSYVLTAVQFGRTAASATVTVTAAGTQTVNLVLSADIGAELPATAHIRGQVADSRTGGPLTCDRALKTVSASDCVATVTVTAPKDPADASKGTVTYTSQATAALNFVYTIPDLDDPDHAGLPPGLYTVTVSAPGYEDTITHVQVAEGQTMPAPPASMPPLGIISGTVTTRVGTPAKASCVLAVPVSVTLPATLPTSCAAEAGAVTCTVSGITGAVPCAMTSTGKGAAGSTTDPNSAPEGTFAIRGLTHGQYQMVLISQDPEYVYTVGTAPLVTLELGADGQFNAVLDRLGRINLTIQHIDSGTGLPVPEENATITVAALPSGTPKAPTVLAGSDRGNPIITGLVAGSYQVSVTATIVPQGGGAPVVSTTAAPSGPIALNQTVNMTLVLASRSGAVIGQVISTVNGTSVGVPGATVAVKGTVIAANGTTGDGVGSAVTDAQGCYAIVPQGWDPSKNSELTSPACPTAVATGAQITLVIGGDPATLISDNVDVSVAAKVVSGIATTSAYPSTGTTITACPLNAGVSLCGNDKVRVLATVPVTALPLSVQPTLDVLGPIGFTAPNLAASPAHITTVSKPTSAGSVTLTAPTSGTWTSPFDAVCPPVLGASDCRRTALTFSDATVGVPDKAMPGVYQFSVDVDGFNPVTIYLNCAFGQGFCVFVPAATDGVSSAVRLQVKQKPVLSVPVSLAVTDQNHVTGNWASATATQTLGTTLPGTLGVSADPPTSAGTPPQVTTLNAHLTFGGAGSVLAPNPGSYSFTVSGVKGYDGDIKVSATCGADFTDPCAVSQPASPDPYPVFDSAGSTVALDHSDKPDGTPFSFDDISVYVSPNPGSKISADVAWTSPSTTGNVTWTDSTAGLFADQTIPRSYTATISLKGFADYVAIVNCLSGGSCSAGPVTLKRLPEASGTLTIPLAPGETSITVPPTAFSVSGPAGSSVAVTAGTPSYLSGIATVPLIWSDSTVGIDTLVPVGSYSLDIAVPGYEPTTVVCDVSAATSCTADAALALNPKPAMALTIVPPSGTAPTVTVDHGVTVTAAADGTLTWHQNDGSPDGVVKQGTYTITASLAGYEVAAGSATTFTCAAGAGNCDFPSITLVKDTDLVVSLVSGGTTVTARARVTLTHGGSASSSPITTTGSATYTGRSTAGAASAGGSWADDTYTLAVEAAGYRFVPTSDATPPTVTCSNGGTTVPSFVLIPGGTTTCTVTLTPLASISGSVVADAIPLAGAATGTSVLPGMTLSAANGGVTVNAAASSGAGSNEFTLTGEVSSSGPTSDVEGLAAGVWTISATKTGYYALSGTVTVSCVGAASATNPDASGFCSGGYEITAVSPAASTTASYLSLSGQTVTVHMVAKPVKLTVTFGSLSSLPGGQLTLTSTAGGAWTCGMPTPAGGEHCTTSGGSVIFASVPPGTYSIGVTFDNGLFSPIVAHAVTIAAGPDYTEQLPVTARINSITGFVKDSLGNLINGANVQLCSATCPATEYGGAGTFATVTVGTSGKFTFSNVADGTYHLVTTKAGYADNTGGNFVVNFDNGAVPTQNVVLVAPLRQTLSMTFTGAPSGLSLTGAAVTLTQSSNNGRVADDGPLTATTITGAGTVASPYLSTLPQVPTGTYNVTVEPGTAAAPFALPAGSVIVTAGGDVQNAPLAVVGAAAALSVTSSVPARPLPADVPFSLTLASVTAATNPMMVRAGDNKSAALTVYLPPGTTTWQPVLSGGTWTGWSATSASVTVSAAGALSGVQTQALSAPTPTVTVTVTKGGTALAAGQSVTLAVTPSAGVSCGSTTSAGGVIACTGLSPSSTFGISATWTDGSSNKWAGYAPVTTTSAGDGAVTIDVKATPSALISVTDGSGAAASGASVAIYDHDTGTAITGSPFATDAAGKVLVTGLTATKTYWMFASSSDSSLKAPHVAFTAATNTLSAVSASLAATVSLVVTVSDSVSSAKIAGATASVTVNGLSAVVLGGGTSAATTGEATITGLALGEKVDIAVSATGYTASSSLGVTLAATNSVLVSLTASPPPTYAVTPAISIDSASATPASDTAVTITVEDSTSTIIGTITGTITTAKAWTAGTSTLPQLANGTYTFSITTPASGVTITSTPSFTVTSTAISPSVVLKY